MPHRGSGATIRSFAGRRSGVWLSKKWRRCWEHRWTSSDPDGDGDRWRAPIRYHADVRDAWAAAGPYYRWQRPPRARPPRRPSPRALLAEERAEVLAVLHEPRFVDVAPAEVYATLLDEGQYLCSQRTMYRLLATHHEVLERRNQLRHPRSAAPELLARLPNELWSWDITKLLGPAKWTYFYLYVMLDGTWSAGWWPIGRAPRSPSGSSARRAAGRESVASSSRFTPTAGPP